jgi:CHASE1-domain containing sensor protein
VPQVGHAHRELFEHRTTAQTGIPFLISQKLPDKSRTPAPPADFYYPFQLASPLRGNEETIGYDIRNSSNAKF